MRPSSSRGGRRLQRSTSATVNGDCVNMRRTVQAGRDRDVVPLHNTSLTVGRSRLKKEENYEVMRTSPHAFSRLQSLQLVTLMFIEPANSLYIVWY